MTTVGSPLPAVTQRFPALSTWGRAHGGSIRWTASRTGASPPETP